MADKNNSLFASRNVFALSFARLLQIAVVGLVLIVPDGTRPLLAANYPFIASVTTEDGSRGTYAGDTGSGYGVTMFDGSAGVLPNGWNEWSSSFDPETHTATTFATRFKNEMGSNSQVSLNTKLFYQPRAKVTVEIDGEGPWDMALDLSRVGSINVTWGSGGANIGGSAYIVVGALTTTITGGSLSSGSLNLGAEPQRGSSSGTFPSTVAPTRGVIHGNGKTTLVFDMAYGINTDVWGGTTRNMAASWMGGQARQNGGGNISGMQDPQPSQGLFLSGTLTYDTIPVANPDPSDPSDPAYIVKSNVMSSIGNVLANDTDIDAGDKDRLTVSVIDTAKTRGTVTNKIYGAFNYDPTSAFGFLEIGQKSTDSFLYRANDGQKDSEPGQVTVTVQGAQTAANYLDTGFNSTGTAVRVIGPSLATARAVVITPDGKTVVAGYAYNGVDDVALLRYGANGKLDTTFGVGGVVNTILNGNHFMALGLAAQSNGKLVAAGKTCTAPTMDGKCNNYDSMFVRFNEDGSLDSTFGGGGVVRRDTDAAMEQLSAIAVQPDGKIVSVGYSCINSDEMPCTDYDILLVRSDSKGVRDGSFGVLGIVKVAVGAFSDQAFALAVQKDGKLVVAGASCNVASRKDGGCDDASSVLMRFNTNGAFDTGFGTNGIVRITSHTGTTTEHLNAVLVQEDGKIVAVGATCMAGDVAGCSDKDFLLVRVDSSGVPDVGFGTNGIVTSSVGVGDDVGYGIAQQRDGKLLVGGFTSAIMTPNGAKDAFALLRFNNNGLLDPSFSIDGKIVTEIKAENNDRAYAMAVMPAVSATTAAPAMPAMRNGKVVMAGTSMASAEQSSVAVVSYQAMPDSDKDGWTDDVDAFPNDPNESLDSDSDGMGNNADPDDDNDGDPDVVDRFPYNPAASVDSDMDGLPDEWVVGCDLTCQQNSGLVLDTDRDGDGKSNTIDNCPLIANSSQTDADNDFVGDLCDNCPDTSNTDQLDSNKNGKGDACDIQIPPPVDQDGDGRPDAEDNCPTTPNADQANGDGDSKGNACDFPPGEPTHPSHFKRLISERLKACAAAGKPGCI